MDSILTSIKKLLGIAEEYQIFDNDIMIHINSVFAILNQIGVGPVNGFSISGKSEKWNDFIPNNDSRLNSVVTYVYLKVKLIFDPPQSSTTIKAMEETISELEWRLNIQVDTGEEGINE